MKNIILSTILFMALSCTPGVKNADNINEIDTLSQTKKLVPKFKSDTVKHDTDDPAIWINYQDSSKSLVLGTDKDEDGALYVFDLEGKVIEDKVVRNLQRPNNVDVEYGLTLNGKEIDVAVVTERFTSKLRIFSLPDMVPIDNGGISVFEGEKGEEYRDLMGISMYRRPSDKAIFAIVGRKNGPVHGTYLWQYLIEGTEEGTVKATLVRKFGNYSGVKEIEAIAVDDSLGYVYYSDEQVGVRKYYADPEMHNDELALFATDGFTADHEGISIYAMTGRTGYIIVSDQQANKFHIFTREGTSSDPHNHQLVKVVDVSTESSDGSETVNFPLLPHFPYGLFVAMSEGKHFQYYGWEQIAGEDLKVKPPSAPTPN